jgi:hypothetical protein
MKQMMFSIMLRIVACVLMLCASVPTFGVAAQVQHTDNDLGCLSQVIDGQGTFSPTTIAEGGKEWGVAARAEAQWRHPWEASGTFVTEISLTN